MLVQTVDLRYFSYLIVHKIILKFLNYLSTNYVSEVSVVVCTKAPFLTLNKLKSHLYECKVY